jgi:hypothetical protein
LKTEILLLKYSKQDQQGGSLDETPTRDPATRSPGGPQTKTEQENHLIIQKGINSNRKGNQIKLLD